MEHTLLHRPVLLHEVREWFAIKPGMVIVDGTLGDGGHSAMFCEQTGDAGLVIGVDRDPEALPAAFSRMHSYGKTFTAVNGNFKDIPDLIPPVTDRPVDRVLLDLGWSTTQFMTRGRGFSFLTNEILDMRFNPAEDAPSAGDIVNTATEEELVRIFRLYGEEPRSQKIADAIISAREKSPITTTQQLANAIVSVAPRTGKIHPATQVFQALRIAVNDELNVLHEALQRITDFIPVGGRVGVITFHSLEDRIVKRFVTARTDVAQLTKRPIVPTLEEVRDNPRSRSSKFRIFEKI